MCVCVGVGVGVRVCVYVYVCVCVRALIRSYVCAPVYFIRLSVRCKNLCPLDFR